MKDLDITEGRHTKASFSILEDGRLYIFVDDLYADFASIFLTKEEANLLKQYLNGSIE